MRHLSCKLRSLFRAAKNESTGPSLSQQIAELKRKITGYGEEIALLDGRITEIEIAQLAGQETLGQGHGESKHASHPNNGAARHVDVNQDQSLG